MKRISKTIAMAIITALILGVSVFCMTACGDQPTNGFVYELSSEGDYYVVMSYAGKGESVSVPAEYNGKPVKEIAANAFSGNISLTSITVPNSVTAIGQGAFGGCSALRNIVLPFTGSSSNATGESAMFGYVFGQKMYADCVAVKQYYADKEFALYYLPASLTTVGIGKNIAARSFSGMSDLKELCVFCFRYESNFVYLRRKTFVRCFILGVSKFFGQRSNGNAGGFHHYESGRGF